MSWSRAFVVCVFVSAQLGASSFDFAAANSVTGDQDRAGYVARGGVAFDASFTGDDSVRQASPVCPDCQWRTSGMCHIASPDEDVGFCGGIAAGCPSGRWLVKVWRRVGDSDWGLVGTWCASDAGFVTSNQISQRAQFQSWVFLPPLVVSVQPANPVPVNVPVFAWANQPRQFGPTTLALGDVTVRLTAVPTWHWQFGSGFTAVTDQPGSGWPNGEIRHTYRRAGVREVVVVTKWRAWWQIANGPMVAVGEELEQSDSVMVDVRQARALLKARK